MKLTRLSLDAAGLCITVAVILATAGCEKIDPDAEDAVEVAAFYGGYGDAWFKEVARRYEEARGGEVSINFWAHPRVDVKLRPRILQKTPPDLCWPLVGTLPLWTLIPAGELYPFDEALDGPAWGEKGGTWRETFSPGALDNFTYEGKVYGIPWAMGVWVIWYDRAMFRRNGWEVPATWEELLALCRRIKQTGLAPFAFQGLYPHFYGWPYVVATFQRIGGMEKYYAYQNMEPGVFLDPDFIRACELWQELATDYFQEGCWGMSLAAQTEWAKGHTAMVLCGLWLKNELGDNIPPGFEMDCFGLPVVDGKVENAKFQPGGAGGEFFLFARAKHRREAMEFMRFMTGKEMMRLEIEMLDSLNPVPASYDDDVVSAELAGAVEIIKNSKAVYGDRVFMFYVPWTMQVLPPLLTGMLKGDMSPHEFAQRLEDATEKELRRNPDVYKPPPVAVKRF